MSSNLDKLLSKDIYDNLPEVIKSYTDLFTGREKDILLISMLGTLSASMPNVSGVYGGQVVYPPLYIFIVAPPASGKGVMNFSKMLIQAIHDKLYSERKQEIEECRKQKKKSKDTSDCPPIRVKIIPGNISSAEIYAMINNSDFGGLIFESEADTLSTILQQDWSSFSDVLRKAFHHESISISRKTDSLYFEVANPKLSIVLSGTENQVIPLVSSKENGLFSRFIYYHFADQDKWKNVFTIDKSLIDIFKEGGATTFINMYGLLRARQSEIVVSFSETQKKLFNKEFDLINNNANVEHSLYFNSVVKRHGLIMYRITMILSILRNINSIQTIHEIEVNNVDFENSLRLTKQLLNHALYVFNTVTAHGLSEYDETLLYNLNVCFTRKEAIDEGLKLGYTERTIDNKLKTWKSKKIIRKVTHGNYIRL